jgi:hypothetical protein
MRVCGEEHACDCKAGLRGHVGVVMVVADAGGGVVWVGEWCVCVCLCVCWGGGGSAATSAAPTLAVSGSSSRSESSTIACE